MQLSVAHIESLREQGFLVVSNALAAEPVAEAHRLVSEWLTGKGGSTSEGLLEHERIGRLLVPVWPLFQRLFNEEIAVPDKATQLTAWHPSAAQASWPPAPGDGMDFHVDAPRPLVDAGLLLPDGMERRSEIIERLGRNVPMPDFLATVAVPLTAVRSENVGNLTVLAGSHKRLADHFGETGTSFANYSYGAPGPDVLDYGVPETLVQLQFEPGDLVLLNSQLLHGVVPNRSSEVRLTVFFRLGSAARESARRPHLDPWTGWPSIPVGRP